VPLEQLASHPLAALALALVVIAGLCVAVRVLWRELRLTRDELHRLYEMNSQLTTAALMAATGRSICNAVDQTALVDVASGPQAQTNTPDSSPGPDQPGPGQD
jgi:hypothetical protein